MLQYILYLSFTSFLFSSVSTAQSTCDNQSGWAKAAAILRASINQSVDPCQDFFEFACGTWKANNPIPGDLTSYDPAYEIWQKVTSEMQGLFEDDQVYASSAINTVKQFYRSCINMDEINRLKSTELLRKTEEFGYWPLIHGTLWKPENFDLTTLLAEVGLARYQNIFISYYVAPDDKNVSRRILRFDQSDLWLPSRDYYLNQTRYARQIDAYIKYITGRFELIAQDANVGNKTNEIQAAVKEILDFETEYAKTILAEEERRNVTKMYNLRKLSDMDQIAPAINWKKYFRMMAPENMWSYLESDPEVILSDPDTTRRISDLLLATDKRILANYILFRYSGSWNTQLDERFENLTQEYLKILIGTTERPPRWKLCISDEANLNINKMAFAGGAMYIRNFFDMESKQVALEMVEDLRKAYIGMLRENDWMDQQTRSAAIEKAQSIAPLIGFDDFLLNDTLLDKYYENLTLEPNLSYAAMTEKCLNWHVADDFNKLMKKPDRFDSETSPDIVNAFYDSIKNALIFPAAILQSPFFDKTYPKAFNYGAIGMIMGHEITHGFDDQGAEYGKDGNLKQWWTKASSEEFQKRAQCIIDQYSRIEVPDTGNLHINGELTQGENIADNGGIKEAFNAYQSYLENNGNEDSRNLPGLERYSNEQIFFISFGQAWCGTTRPEYQIDLLLSDPHSPNKYRVNVPLMNLPEFTKAFNCPPGSSMNPPDQDRCSVW